MLVIIGGVFMKKILILFAFLALTLESFAASYKPETKVDSIAQTLLTKNGISISDVKFEVTSKEVDNSTFAQDRILSISNNDLKYAGNDNETAYVIANELGHIIAGHASKGKLISSVVGTNQSNDPASGIVENIAQTKQEKEADVIAVNLMANAGYNPLSGIVVLTKQTQTAWNAVLGKPANADRAMNIYDYTVYAYPQKAKAGYNCNEYKNFLTYANNVLSQRKESKKLQSKSEKELKKQRKNSVNQISKFKTRGAMSSWDAINTILNGTE